MPPRSKSGDPLLDLRAATIPAGSEELVVLSFVSSRVLAHPALAPLSVAEREVVALVVGGRSNTEIAEIRRLSEGTIRKQVESAYRKLGVHSRSELAVLLAESAG